MRVLEGMQSALNPQGAHANVVAEITWVLIIGGFAIFAIVAAVAAYALFARRENAMRLQAGPLIVGGGIVFPLVVLSALLVYTVVRAGSLGLDSGETALRIEVTGEQWWWRVRYLDEEGKLDFETANEIRIPAGRTVELPLRSADVIHSFWVPALAGKLDMVPGRTNRLRIAAENPGRYRGQCAEYCGGPHAFMAFLVIAEPPERYAEWAARERAPAVAPARDATMQGEKLFVTHCAACHTIRGTPASGTRGPDLTHIGSRLTLAAGVLPNNAGTLAGWIASSQHLKPGNLMPSFQHFHGDELQALARYLEALK
ncbi:MAG TPA: cytochrome c oxidase subunit II [Burkholderiales bacterium]|nr:cytochrome c oxidase subunit II [Burkholderiales bacterium]